MKGELQCWLLIPYKNIWLHNTARRIAGLSRALPVLFMWLLYFRFHCKCPMLIVNKQIMFQDSNYANQLSDRFMSIRIIHICRIDPTLTSTDVQQLQDRMSFLNVPAIRSARADDFLGTKWRPPCYCLGGCLLTSRRCVGSSVRVSMFALVIGIRFCNIRASN